MEAKIVGKNAFIGFKPYRYKDKNNNPMYGMTFVNNDSPETLPVSEAIYESLKGIKMGEHIEITLRKQYRGFDVVSVVRV